MRLRHLAARLAVLATAVAVAVGMSATAAAAHNVLLSTAPADGSSVDQMPASVTLTFDLPAIALGTAVRVTGPDGQVADGAAQLIDNRVVQKLRSGAPPGHYTVDWRVTSADGHPVTGSFSFTAGTPAGASAPAAADGTSVDPPAAASGGSGSHAGLIAGAAGGGVVVVLALVLAAVLLRRRRAATGDDG